MYDDDASYADDADNDNSSSLSKRTRFTARTALTSVVPLGSGGIGGAGSRDPLDLIPSSVIDARRLGRIANAATDYTDESNSLDGSLKRPRRRVLGPQTYSNRYFQYPRQFTRVSRLGEGYVFHPDSEFTIHFHRSSAELAVRVFKQQFSARLKQAINQHHKEFLTIFHRDFVLTGRLQGCSPPAHVLNALRLERIEEWRLQKLRKQKQLQLLQQKQQQLMLLQQHKRRMPATGNAALNNVLPGAAGNIVNAFDSEMDFELETESQLSSASQEIMKFEEIIEDGTGRLIDGLVMEPEMEDVIGSAASGVSGSSSSSRCHGGIDALPRADNAARMVSSFAGSGANTGDNSFRNHLTQNQMPQSQG